jgi:hypothetical protein
LQLSQGLDLVVQEKNGIHVKDVAVPEVQRNKNCVLFLYKIEEEKKNVQSNCTIRMNVLKVS